MLANHPAFLAEANKRVRRGGRSDVWNAALDAALEGAYARCGGDRVATLAEMARMYPERQFTPNRVNHRVQRLGLPTKYKRESDPKLVAVGVTLSPRVREVLRAQVGKRGCGTFAALCGALLSAVADDDLFDALLGECS